MKLFPKSLGPDDQVAMEATSNALAIARILEGHVARVVLAHPRKVRVIAEAKVKTDQSSRQARSILRADRTSRDQQYNNNAIIIDGW